MSDRFEWITADGCPVETVSQHTYLGDNTVDQEMALLLGEPGSTALVIEGTREEILALLDEARALVVPPPHTRPLVTIYLPDDPGEDGTHYHLHHHLTGARTTLNETGDAYAELGGILDDADWEVPNG